MNPGKNNVYYINLIKKMAKGREGEYREGEKRQKYEGENELIFL